MEYTEEEKASEEYIENSHNNTNVIRNIPKKKRQIKKILKVTIIIKI